MADSTQIIVDQLLVFDVGTKEEILNAINKVVNKTDINEIIDYIKNNQNDNNIDEESKQDEFNKYIKMVKELDEKRIHKTLNILDYKHEKYNGIPAYIYLIVSLDTSHFNVTISKDIKQTSSLPFDHTNQDPFNYFGKHWKEYNEKKKLQIHNQITQIRTLFLKVHGSGGDSTSLINEIEQKELDEIGKKFDVLNNLERKVYLLKYFLTVCIDIQKLQKYDSFWNKFGYQMFDSEKEVLKFNNASNGDWYQNEEGEWKYAETQYIFKYNIINDYIRTQYMYYKSNSNETQIITENDDYCIIKAMNNESKIYMAIKIIFKTSNNCQQIYETEVDILNKANHKNIIKLVKNVEDDSNYYIVTRYYKKRGLLQCINKITPDIELTEKIAAACINDLLSILQCYSIRELNVEQFEFRTDIDEKRDLVLTDYHALISLRDDTKNINFKQLGQMTYKIIIGKDIEMDEKNEFEIDIPNSVELKYLSQEFEDFVLMLLNKKCSMENVLKHNWLKKADYNPSLFPAKHGLWTFLNFIQGLSETCYIRMQSYLKIFKIDDNKLGIYDFFLSEGNKKERKSFNSGFYIYYIRENKWQISAPLEMDCGDSFWNEFNHTKLCPMISKYNKLTNILTIYEDFTQTLVEYDVQNDIWNVDKYKKRLLSKISSGGSSGSGDWFRYDATRQNGILINDTVHTFVGDQFAKNYKHFVCDMFGNGKRKEIQTDDELKALKKNYKCNFIDSLGEMVYCSLKNCLYVISGKGGVIYKYSLTESKWYNVSDKKCEGDQLKGVSCYNGEYILFFGGYKSESSTTGNIYIYVLNVETEKLIKSNVRLPFYDGIYCGITKNECDIIGGDKTLFLDGIARMRYGYVVKIADSIIDLIYEYMSIEYLYMITQKGNLCKIAVNEIIFSNETMYIPRQDSIQNDNAGCLIQ